MEAVNWTDQDDDNPWEDLLGADDEAIEEDEDEG